MEGLACRREKPLVVFAIGKGCKLYFFWQYDRMGNGHIAEVGNTKLRFLQGYESVNHHAMKFVKGDLCR